MNAPFPCKSNDEGLLTPTQSDVGEASDQAFGYSQDGGANDSGVGIPQANSASGKSGIVLRRRIPAWKRGLDIVGVILLTPVLLPFLLLIAAYIKCVSRGPALFVQSRLGYGGEYFAIYKFRTMHVAEESRDDEHRKYVASFSDGTAPIAKPDYRNSLIPGGSLLRKTSVDELPQLLNVLLGNMSLVGPRPDVLKAEDYSEYQLRRFEALPGMTGLWQVSGKNQTSFEEMIELDLRYIEHQSIWKDLHIMLRTVLVLLTERNE